MEKSKKKTLNSVKITNTDKNKFTLYDLNTVVTTEVDIGIVLPLKIDIAKIDIKSANLAMSFSYQMQSKDNLPQAEKKFINPTKVVIDFENKEVTYDYTALTYKVYIEWLAQKDAILSMLKFVDYEILDFDNELCLFEWLLDNGFDAIHFSKLFSTINYWVSWIIEDFRKKVLDVLMLEDKDGKSYNMALLDLKSTYEHCANCYYDENINKANSQWSFREVELNRSYWTKKTMIDNAVNKIEAPKASLGGDTIG